MIGFWWLVLERFEVLNDSHIFTSWAQRCYLGCSFLIFRFILCVCVDCMYVCVPTVVRWWCWVPWNWTFQVILSHHVGAGNRTWILCKSSKCSNWAIFKPYSGYSYPAYLIKLWRRKLFPFGLHFSCSLPRTSHPTLPLLIHISAHHVNSLKKHFSKFPSRIAILVPSTSFSFVSFIVIC